MGRLKPKLFIKLERVRPLRVAGQLHHPAVALFREPYGVLHDGPAQSLPLMGVGNPHGLDERARPAFETQIWR